MVQEKDIVKHERIYEVLPKPKNDLQFNAVLNWLKDDREKVFAQALSFKRLDFIRDVLIIFVVIALCLVAYYLRENTGLIFTIISTLAGILGLKKYVDKRNNTGND
jgi:Na+/proline symporter